MKQTEDWAGITDIIGTGEEEGSLSADDDYAG